MPTLNVPHPSCVVAGAECACFLGQDDLLTSHGAHIVLYLQLLCKALSHFNIRLGPSMYYAIADRMHVADTVRSPEARTEAILVPSSDP